MRSLPPGAPCRYDKDKSGSINAKEMRTCLFSLGEERTKSQIEGYMAEFGSAGVLKFEAFRELMVTLRAWPGGGVS